MALLAHQLVTPLSTISALAQGLMRRSERLSKKEIRQRGEKIWLASRRVQELIETIMSHTRANAGVMAVNPRPFNLRAMVGRVCQEQGRREPDRRFDLDIDRTPDDFLGDAVLLEQALVIVLSNAMKYSSPGEPISVAGRTSGGEAYITVTDRGIGVPEKDLPFLTQPFFRGRNAKHMPGTGLGLSLARHILQLHGGSLRIESQEGHGTTATLVLPMNGRLEAGAGI